MSVSRKMLAGLAATGLTVAATAPAFADSRIEAGRLTCTQGPDLAAQDPAAVRCIFTSADGRVRDHYIGRVDRAALDAQGSRGDRRIRLTYTVTTHSRTFRSGLLAGRYGNGAAGTGLRGPADGGLLIGGPDRVVILRPVPLHTAPGAERRVIAPTRLTLQRIGTVEERIVPEDDVDTEPQLRR